MPCGQKKKTTKTINNRSHLLTNSIKALKMVHITKKEIFKKKEEKKRKQPVARLHRHCLTSLYGACAVDVRETKASVMGFSFSTLFLCFMAGPKSSAL